MLEKLEKKSSMLVEGGPQLYRKSFVEIPVIAAGTTEL
jgi:hypothetical protein